MAPVLYICVLYQFSGDRWCPVLDGTLTY